MATTKVKFTFKGRKYPKANLDANRQAIPGEYVGVINNITADGREGKEGVYYVHFAIDGKTGIENQQMWNFSDKSSAGNARTDAAQISTLNAFAMRINDYCNALGIQITPDELENNASDISDVEFLLALYRKKLVGQHVTYEVQLRDGNKPGTKLAQIVVTGKA